MFTGECNYGGKIEDVWDRRCITEILEDFVCPDVTLKHGYLFSNISKQYGLPYRCEHHDYITHIHKVPRETVPEVLGLHSNAGYTYNCMVSSF